VATKCQNRRSSPARSSALSSPSPGDRPP
jgi:hypothetical protein